MGGMTVDVSDGDQVLDLVYEWLESKRSAPTNETVLRALKRIAQSAVHASHVSIPKSTLLETLDGAPDIHLLPVQRRLKPQRLSE